LKSRFDKQTGWNKAIIYAAPYSFIREEFLAISRLMVSKGSSSTLLSELMGLFRERRKGREKEREGTLQKSRRERSYPTKRKEALRSEALSRSRWKWMNMSISEVSLSLLSLSRNKGCSREEEEEEKKKKK